MKDYRPNHHTAATAIRNEESDWITSERCPMPAGTEIPVAGTDIRIVRDGKENDYNTGSTCLVYKGHITSGSGVISGTRVIIKEFYPFSSQVLFDLARRKDGSLHAPGSTLTRSAYQDCREQFLQGLAYQKELAASSAMEISVRPLFVTAWGDSLYIISDVHNGRDLQEFTPSTLREKLSAAISFAEAMGILHESGYIMTDIKPDNFLWIKSPNAVRIIDTDSIVPFSDAGRISSGRLFGNRNHLAPEIEAIAIKMSEGASPRDLARLKKICLTPDADRYSMGIFLFHLFWGRYPASREISSLPGPSPRSSAGGFPVMPPALSEEFLACYGNEIVQARVPAEPLLRSILEILGRLLIQSPGVRRSRGYSDEKTLISDLQTTYMQLTSRKLTLRRETARANGRFAAYNLLQKHPLFDYPFRPCRSKDRQPSKNFTEADHTKDHRSIGTSHSTELRNENSCRTAVSGRHTMRSDMLSAMISVGQMPDLPLTVRIIAEDASDFWRDYISEGQNPALARAVTWEPDPAQACPRNTGPYDGPGMTDPQLVARPLAHILPCRFRDKHEEAAALTSAFDAGTRYFIILEEDFSRRRDLIRHLLDTAVRERQDTFIAFLRYEHEDFTSAVSAIFPWQDQIPQGWHVIRSGDSIVLVTQDCSITLYMISAEAFTETYSERMFSERVYQMGLMAHMYYSMDTEADNGGHKENPLHTLRAQESSFQKDVYGIASSERCALHGLYKMAALGIDARMPGHAQKYQEMTEDPATLEKLAWIEHLSWTAFMLTSGAVPVSMEDYDSYAYTGSNDWKDKSARHLRHPLLCSSLPDSSCTLRNYSSLEEITPEIYAKLDPLDRVSVRITQWYADHRTEYLTRYRDWLLELQDLCEESFKAADPACTDPADHTHPAACIDPAPRTDAVVHTEPAAHMDPDQLLTRISRAGTACIHCMGSSLHPQDQRPRTEWEDTARQILSLFDGHKNLGAAQRLFSNVRTSVMKPAFDAMGSRDFKQKDRDLCIAVLDILT